MRTSIAINLSGYVSISAGDARDFTEVGLETEDGENLVQETGDLIMTEEGN